VNLQDLGPYKHLRYSAYFERNEVRGDTFTSIPKEVLDHHDPLGVGEY
jgi:hypothetical protein